jgi:hypothetical protein
VSPDVTAAPRQGASAFPGRAGRGWALFLAYVLVPLLTGCCVISGAFQGGGWVPLDAGDEAAETFVQLPLVYDQLAAGDILKINLFNNFGTPILGEPVVYPFALHAWTYFFFRPVMAMLVNKFILAALSVAVLTVFFSRYFPLLICSVCALLAFSSPAFFYYFQNHPHQGALLYYSLILLAVRRFFDQPSATRGFWLYAACLVFLLSVGVNGALLGTGFVFAYAFLLAGRRWRLLGWGLALWLAALVAVYPHFFEFFRLAAESARKQLDYQNLTSVSRIEFLRGLLVHRLEALQTEIFYSAPVLALLLAGLALLVLKGRHRGLLTHHVSRFALVLGLLPTLAVILCRLFPGLAAAVPLVKAMNISRVLWFSDIFLMLAAGIALNAIYQAVRCRRLGWRLLCLALLGVGLLPRYRVFQEQANFFRMHETQTQFYPVELLGYMQRSTRLATLLDPIDWSQDTKVNRVGVLGSAGRSIILQKAFRDRLLGKNLIALGFHGMTYYFLPAPPQVLAQYGIRYCLTEGRNPQLAEWGWNLQAEVQTTPNPHLFALYENPAPVTPFYIAGGQLEFLQRYLLNGNQMSVELPPGSFAYDVVATFLARPGWKASVSGQPLPIEPSEDLFIRVHVPPGQGTRQLRLRYEPYSTAWLLGCFALSLGGAGLLCWLLARDFEATPAYAAS